MVILMVSTILITVILAGVISEYRDAKRRQSHPPAAGRVILPHSHHHQQGDQK